MSANRGEKQEISSWVLLLSLLRRRKRWGSRRSRNCFGTFLNGYSTRLPLCHERNHRTGDELLESCRNVCPTGTKKWGQLPKWNRLVARSTDETVEHKFARMTPEQRPRRHDQCRQHHWDASLDEDTMEQPGHGGEPTTRASCSNGAQGACDKHYTVLTQGPLLLRSLRDPITKTQGGRHLQEVSVRAERI